MYQINSRTTSFCKILSWFDLIRFQLRPFDCSHAIEAKSGEKLSSLFVKYLLLQSGWFISITGLSDDPIMRRYELMVAVVLQQHSAVVVVRMGARRLRDHMSMAMDGAVLALPPRVPQIVRTTASMASIITYS